MSLRKSVLSTLEVGKDGPCVWVIHLLKFLPSNFESAKSTTLSARCLYVVYLPPTTEINPAGDSLIKCSRDTCQANFSCVFMSGLRLAKVVIMPFLSKCWSGKNLLTSSSK